MTSSENYNYAAYFENLLNYGNDAARTHLECDGWCLDTGDNLNEQGEHNKGFLARKKWFANSNERELEGKLHVDLFNLPHYLVNGVSIDIVLKLAEPEFYIKEGESGSSILKITQATLKVPHFDISPSILLSHNRLMQKGEVAFYPYKNVEVKTFSVSAGNSEITCDNLILGKLPITLMVALVDDDAFHGRRSKNPFSLNHYSMTKCGLYVNGTPHEVEMSYDGSSNHAVQPFRQLYSALGVHHNDWGNQVTLHMFTHGSSLFVWNLTPDKSGNDDHISKPETGNIRLVMTFKDALPNAVTAIVYAEYEAALAIDFNRVAMVQKV
ncbi:uncharacterized protein F54H12.2-like [Ischnura elegans]|uniref:uncharacterized protein F54H12.2-like n=1 Tax=Ischnura elegans TaxID=197161 RepID=UPI001ED86748|nr:uncharacterized protein F54H12.2-like [Ischnura elegans]